MAKKTQSPQTGYTVLQAIALYLCIEAEKMTGKQEVKRMLVRVREITGQAYITSKDIKAAIADWITKGWVSLNQTVLSVHRAARSHIEKIADTATSPTPAQA